MIDFFIRDFYHASNYLGLLFLASLVALRLPLPFVPIWCISVFRALQIVFGGDEIITVENIFMLDTAVMHGFATLVIFTLAYFLVPYWLLNVVIVATSLVNLVLLLVPPRYGILSNPSMSGSLLALSIPFLINVALKLPQKTGRVAWGIAALSCVAIVLTGATTPIVMLVSMVFAALSYVNPRTAVPVGLIFSGFLGCLSYPFWGVLSHSTGRVEHWAASWELWRYLDEPVFGSGIGSFQVLSLTLPSTSNLFFLHSDWGQLLFETGWAGLFASLFAYGFVLVRARAYPLLFCATVGWFWFALTNMPMRYFLPSLVMLVIVQRLYPPFSNRFFQGNPPQMEM